MHTEKTPLAYSVAVGADHAGYELSRQIITYWHAKGENLLDVGTHSADSTDYPLYASKVCNAILQKQCERGLLICSSGIGMAIAANRFRGIRAVWAERTEIARLGRQHNNANVLCAGSAWTNFDQLVELWQTFVSTPFDGGERHVRRVNLMDCQ